MTSCCISRENVCNGSLEVAVTKAYARAKSGDSHQFPDGASMGRVCEWPILNAHLPVAFFDIRATLKLGEGFSSSHHELLVVRVYRPVKSFLQFQPRVSGKRITLPQRSIGAKVFDRGILSLCLLGSSSLGLKKCGEYRDKESKFQTICHSQNFRPVFGELSLE